MQPSRRRLRLGEDLGALRQPRRPRVRARGRSASRTACEAVYDVAARSQPPVFVNLDMEEYRDLAPHGRRLPPRARRAGVPPRCRPGSCCRPTCPTPTPSLDELAGVGRRAPPGRRRGRQGAPRQGRQPGDGAASTPSSAGGSPAPYATKAEVDASYKALLERLLDAADGRRAARRRRQPQPVRRGLGARASASVAQCRRSGRASRCSRAWRRRRPEPTLADAGERAAVHAGRHRRGLRREHRLPVAPARRERRAGELPALAVHDHPRLTRVEAERRPLRRRRRRPRTSCRTAPAGRRTAAPSSAASTPDAPFANEPDTDFTQAANRAWIGEPACATERPAALPPLDRRRPTASTTSSERARARCGARGRRRRPAERRRAPRPGRRGDGRRTGGGRSR